jgi:spore germination cell wall hydrolase CwlJ-like protein
MRTTVLFILLLLAFSTPSVGATRQEIICLAKNIYFEANNQSYVGQQAVAWVTLNRVTSGNYPNSICAVVFQYKQFSWTIDGKHRSPRSIKRFSVALAAAIHVYNNYGRVEDPTRGATMYHTVDIVPYWHYDYKPTVIIGDHIFLK